MKLLGILLGLIVMIHVISSVPVDTEENKGVKLCLKFTYTYYCMLCIKSDAVSNVDKENHGEPNKNFVAEVRAYLEEQKRKSSMERNTRQISGCKQ